MTVRVVLDTNIVLSALLFEQGHVAWPRPDPVDLREAFAEHKTQN
jgi:hypothetical protein